MDFERAKKFYSTIFDYQMDEMEMGPIMMGFLPSNPENGGVGGAIVHGPGLSQPSHNGVRVYLNGGDDLSIVLNRVATAGGKVMEPKTEIPGGFGFYATFEDTEGNAISLHSMG